MNTNDITFSSLKELYDRLTPALTSKTIELHRLGYKYIKEEDIWNYLKENKWVNSVDLLLYQMVDDIINVDSTNITYHLEDKLSRTNRNINLEGSDINGTI